MNFLETLHHRWISNRRACILSRRLAQVIPADCSVLDVGCGDGQIAKLISNRRPDLKIRGVDVLLREETWIPVSQFDGQKLPADDDSVDVVMLIDVLHHTEDPMVLLREAKRVARKAIVLKDHTRDGLLAGATLRWMDQVGNQRYGVALPYNYWKRQQWLDAFEPLKLKLDLWQSKLGIYPWPAQPIFDRSLHFVARLMVHDETETSFG